MIENYPAPQKPIRQSFKPVLVSEHAFASLNHLQSWKSCQAMNIRFDLKDLATAFVQVGIDTPGFKELVLSRALENTRQQLNKALQPKDKESTP
jgi:hypothetical protein